MEEDPLDGDGLDEPELAEPPDSPEEPLARRERVARLDPPADADDAGLRRARVPAVAVEARRVRVDPAELLGAASDAAPLAREAALRVVEAAFLVVLAAALRVVEAAFRVVEAALRAVPDEDELARPPDAREEVPRVAAVAAPAARVTLRVPWARSLSTCWDRRSIWRVSRSMSACRAVR